MKIYYSIHKHMHQPYYRAADPMHWDGETDEIFGSRHGPYTHFIPSAIRQYIDGGLPCAGLSTSWSGTLIEQLNRAQRDGLCGGAFAHWADGLKAVAKEKTAGGHPRVDFVAFGYFHPLMPLIPHRNIVKHVQRHRRLVKETFGVDASPVMFPPETAFHVRMIPALREAGVEAVIYDSIHRYRACREYPYGGKQEGMLPPNPAEQVNPPPKDWYQLRNVWAGSKISPSLLRPETIAYEDPDGQVHTIIGVPAERYIGNEDARGGFGALQYPDVFEQLYRNIQQHGTYDPAHPPFFVLHSDGDNHGGGADSYYLQNTGRMVEWLNQDKRFELISIRDYLERFPPDGARPAHVEPGSWSGADNGDPQFMKWFSRYREDYSPDLNSWAVLTALQNLIHSVEDAAPSAEGFADAEQLMLTAETSCYWYWTGQDIWDRQVTEASNAAVERIAGALDGIDDLTPPTIFPPWTIPENPGGLTWGDHQLVAAPGEATVHTLIHDVSGIERARLILRASNGDREITLDDQGPYRCRTGARATASYFTCSLPAGLGDIRYFIEAVDRKGHRARSSLERLQLA
jgi:hypothetical protein